MQDFTERCPAGTGTNGANCPVRKAHAWDSHDEEIKVSKQIYLVDDDGQTGVVPADKVSCRFLTDRASFYGKNTR